LPLRSMRERWQWSQAL
jgi:hypothetical protein